MNLSCISLIGFDGNGLGVIFVGSRRINRGSACAASVSGLAGGCSFVAELGIALRDEEGIQYGQAEVPTSKTV